MVDVAEARARRGEKIRSLLLTARFDEYLAARDSQIYAGQSATGDWHLWACEQRSTGAGARGMLVSASAIVTGPCAECLTCLHRALRGAGILYTEHAAMTALLAWSRATRVSADDTVRAAKLVGSMMRARQDLARHASSNVVGSALVGPWLELLDAELSRLRGREHRARDLALAAVRGELDGDVDALEMVLISFPGATVSDATLRGTDRQLFAACSVGERALLVPAYALGHVYAVLARSHRPNLARAQWAPCENEVTAQVAAALHGQSDGAMSLRQAIAAATDATA